MSNFKTKTQVPTRESIHKVGGVAIGQGYKGSNASGLFSIYADINDAPSASGVADGSAVVVVSGSTATMHVAVSGSYIAL